jgi:hypothetical protein
MQGIMARMQRVSGNAHGRVSRVSQCIQLAGAAVASNQHKPRTVVKSGHCCVFTAPWFDTRVPSPLTITRQHTMVAMTCRQRVGQKPWICLSNHALRACVPSLCYIFPRLGSEQGLQYAPGAGQNGQRKSGRASHV